MSSVTDETDATTPPTRCVAYAAKSTSDVRGSIPTQLEDCRAAIERAGRVFAGDFHDEGKSGWSGNRGDGLAQAKARALALADEYGEAELWVQHSDRISRGDGLNADHLAEVFFSMRRRGVRLRSVQDDGNLEDAIRAVLIGERNNEDSSRKSETVRAGLRRAAERGDWIGRGIVPDGYAVVRDVDAHGRVSRRVIKDPERAHIIALIWEMALAGHSAQSIQLELSTRGFMTSPRRRDHHARPFDVNRISQILDNGTFAGLVIHKGEILPNAGNWPPYVSPEDFFRLREERRARCHATKRKAGRPAEGYLLSELARCGVCGNSTRGLTERRPRADGTRARSYLCRGHEGYHSDARERCAAMPYNAVETDRAVVAGIETLLTDAAAFSEQLLAGRRAEQERLAKIAQDTRADEKAATRAADRAQQRYGDALAADDEATCEALLDVVKLKRDEAKRARTRLSAALDAMQAAVVESESDQTADVMARIWHALDGRVKDAQGDVRRLNSALREWFDAFELHHVDDGTIRIEPLLSATAVARTLRDREPWTEGATKEFTVQVPRSQVAEVRAALLAGRIEVDLDGPPALLSTNPQSPRSKHGVSPPAQAALSTACDRASGPRYAGWPRDGWCSAASAPTLRSYASTRSASRSTRPGV